MRRFVLCCIAMGAFGATLAPSALAANNFSCRGSAARVQAPLLGTVEPTVANGPNDPCVTATPTLIPINAAPVLTAPTVNAKTTNGATQATAFGSVENAAANVGAVALTADVIQANAAATCSSGQVVLSGSSQIVGLKARVLGLPVNVPVNAAPNTVLINLLGIKVTLNEQSTVSGERTVRAIHVAAPGLGIDVVIAEARADFHGSPCAAQPPPPQCSDGVDNADPEDALADAADPGCHTDGDPTHSSTYNPNDNDETNTAHQCSDGVDNADPEDTLADQADGGCHTDGDPGNPGSYNPGDNDETNAQCSDHVDNADQEDTLIDAADPGCHTDGNAGNPGSYNPGDNDEGNTVECNDGVDNADPEDTLIDAADPGCHTDGNAGNGGSYNPFDTSETNSPQCSDGVDNDGDGKADFPADPGCSGPDDNNETNTIPKTDCHDGIDNDNNGLTDFPADPGCTDSYDNSEGAHQGS